jgi:galactonate dehydratase
VDLALWDLAGKLSDCTVSRLAGIPHERVESYLSGLPAGDLATRVAAARHARDAGFRVVKIFHDASEEATLALVDALQAEGLEVAVDALWRLSLPAAEGFLRALEQRSLRWLECPFPPDEIAPHREMARAFRIPLALGESYRTRHELAPFLELDTLAVLQPDLGRSGITETLRIAGEARGRGIQMVPHVSIALGPQLAAAIHVSGALCEYNPTVFSVANRYLVEPLQITGNAYRVPAAPGLGVEIRREHLEKDRLQWPPGTP